MRVVLGLDGLACSSNQALNSSRAGRCHLHAGRPAGRYPAMIAEWQRRLFDASGQASSWQVAMEWGAAHRSRAPG
ncbi:hypothetical protein LAUMK41_03018 [Mycobacterium attenuatum]|nr:hypothetical protein LAUMK41_03018 [Mycobacterium attenuatum]